MIEIVFNPHSIFQINSLDEADELIFNFVKCFVEIEEKINIPIALRCSKQITEYKLTPTKTIYDWVIEDLSKRKEERLYLLQISEKYPLLKDVETKTLNDFYVYDCYINNKQSPEYTLAYLDSLLLISFHSEEIWKKHLLDLKVSKVSETEIAGTTEIIDINSTLKNFSNLDHLTLHEDWFKEILQTKSVDKFSFWSFKNNLFPNLIFTEEVKSNMQNIQDLQYKQVIRKLIDLELLVKKWNDGEFPFDSISGSWSSESNITLQKYKKEHTFTVPSGENLLFNYHLKCTINAWRIYFYPVNSSHKVIIGYIGKHLPTVKNP